MPRRTIQRQAIQAIDKRLSQQEAKRPKSGVVKAIHGSSVDLRVRGSPTLWRNIPVMGDISQIDMEDVVLLNWDHRRPRAIGTGTSSTKSQKKLDLGIPAGDIWVKDSKNYFAGKTVENVLQEIANALREFMNVASRPGVVAPYGLTWDWEGTTLELWWSHLGEGRAIQDYRVRIYSSNGGDRYRTYYVSTEYFAWDFDAQNEDTGGNVDPEVYVDVAARAHNGDLSATISATCVNQPPAIPTSATYNFGRDLVIEYEWPDNADIAELVAELEVSF